MTTEIQKMKPNRLTRIGNVVHNEVLAEALTMASALVAHKGGRRIRGAVWSFAAMRAMVSMAMTRQQQTRERTSSSVTLIDTDHLYHAVQRWLAAHVAPESHSNFSALLQNRTVVYAHSEKGMLRIVHNGVDIIVNNGVDAPAGTTGGGGGGDPFADDDEMPAISGSGKGWLKGFNPKTMSLSSKDISAVRSFLDMIVDDMRTEEKRSKLLVTERWGGWRNESSTPPRQLDTVVLANGIVDSVVTDLESFLRHEQKYVDLGIPWHRGYLFHGPPGTGKTSFARALATHFNIDVYHIALATVQGDASLMDYMRRITPGSILLIEDIDVAGAQVEQRSDDDEGVAIVSEETVSLSGLLNALDGLSTPHGLVTIMTSNFPHKLDSALMRKGRIDKKVDINLADAEQVSRLLERFTGLKIDPIGIPDGLATNDVVEMVKGTFDMDNPTDIRSWLELSIYDTTVGEIPVSPHEWPESPVPVNWPTSERVREIAGPLVVDDDDVIAQAEWER